MESTAVNRKGEETVFVIDGEDFSDLIEELEKKHRNIETEPDLHGINYSYTSSDSDDVEWISIEGGDGDEHYGEETKDPAAPAEPIAPVPVDDNANDPQCIPSGIRFHEHDDRVTYCTKSSEGSEADNEYEEDSEDDYGVSQRRRHRRRHRISRPHTGIKKHKIQGLQHRYYRKHRCSSWEWMNTVIKNVWGISKVAGTVQYSEPSVTTDEL
ncbi:uncharacterized protein LOC111030761 isoform X2 [Myzus persicae]|uniref:uncharacterized protein LOC111030761 isoform X2 n=1 Tax=Myzus persicae TaxID=13164 RepID=UPI000B9360A5|nr:uncharacterized protein LOC111030761 isoform X2 [Myzus persicae]